MASERLTLVVNPGSASRKYAVFANGYKWASINFEFVGDKIVGNVEHAGQKHSILYEDTDFSSVSRYVLPLLHENNVIDESDTVSVIGIRVVAPSKRFLQDELVTDEIEKALDDLQLVVPIHITTVLSEIKQLRINFPQVPVVAVSDSAFHATKLPQAWSYGIDTEIAEKLDIKRYGYHGISVESVVRHLENRGMLMENTIVCHLGSGSSVTAVKNGKSIDTTMGYTPLEGLLMATRSGNIDISAALAVKRELQLDDNGLEQYLNKQSGLQGVSGSSDDIRQLVTSQEQGDERAKLALDLYIYRVQQGIGQMAASLGGVDSIVFTATVGERSNIMRSRILDSLGYLGFVYNNDINNQTYEPIETTNIADYSSKPIIVISTDEAAEIARRAEEYIKS